MLLNDPPLALRLPRLEILANGVPLTGVVEADVASNNHYAADRFRARLALDADPGTATFWAGADEIMLDIRFALGVGGGFFSVIQGAVDTVEIDPIQRLVRLEGRDLTARLIEARTQESFSNRTASEIATILAGRHGLTPVVTATTTPVGRYYQNEHDRMTLDQFSRAMTEWDLLVWLSQQEGFDVFVRGTTLNFQPEQTNPRIQLITLADMMELRLERALTLSGDLEVVVKSWNTRQQSALTQVALASGSVSLGGGEPASTNSTPQRIVLVRPNLTPDQALKLAQVTLAQLTRHRMVIDLTMPGELSLMPGDGILLNGTATGFDQIYRVDEITRRLSMHSGFTQNIRARTGSSAGGVTPPGNVVAQVTG